MALAICAVIVAYLFGSVSSAIITCKLMRLPDPRTVGSGNPGATNVLRLGGKKAAAITMLGDVLKGVIPVLLAKYLGLSHLIIALVMFAAVLGHLYPVFFKFQGGKGIATAMGALFALNWPTGCAFLGTWLLVAIISRYSSLSSLTATIFAPLYLYYFTRVDEYYLTMLVVSLLLIYRHRSNIRKLATGKESKIGKK